MSYLIHLQGINRKGQVIAESEAELPTLTSPLLLVGMAGMQDEPGVVRIVIDIAVPQEYQALRLVS